MFTLKLGNFRRFIQTDEIRFLPGLTIISGPNGAGKSTLVESLVYALFGPKKSATSDIRSDSATPKEETSVECDLIIDGQYVKIRRFSDRAEVWVNNVQQIMANPGSMDQATAQIRRLLGGLTRDQFTSTYIALQGDTAGLVAEKAAKRREIIEAILQLDVLQRAIRLQEDRRTHALGTLEGEGRAILAELALDTEAQMIWNEFTRKRSAGPRSKLAQAFQAEIREVIEHRQEVLTQAHQQVTSAKEGVAQLQRECAAAAQEVQSALGLLSVLNEKQAAYREFDGPLLALGGKIQQVQNDLERLERQIQEANTYNQAAAEYERLQTEIGKRQQRLAVLPLVAERHRTLKRARDTWDNLNSELQKLPNVDDQLTQAEEQERQDKKHWEDLRTDPTANEFQQWQARKTETEFKQQQYTEALQALQHTPDKAKCPTCDQPLTKHSAAQRTSHLLRWLQHDLPTLQSELRQQQRALTARKNAWIQSEQAARTKWSGSVQATAAAQRRAEQRGGLLAQYENCEAQLTEAQRGWDQLGETASFDPQEQPRLKQELASLQTASEDVRSGAELHAQLQNLQQRAAEKQRALGELLAQQDSLLARQAATGHEPATHQRAEEALVEAKQEEQRAQAQVVKAQGRCPELELAAAQAHRGMERAEQCATSFSECLLAFQSEDRLHTLLSDFQAHFFTATTQKVTQRARDLMLRAVTDQSILGLKFDGEDLYYLDASHARRSIGRLSGGEKALVGLCLRLALAEYAQAASGTGKVSFLILDEILGSLDDERREAVQQIFEAVLQRGVFQHIIMVTHMESVKQGWHAAGMEVIKVDAKTSRVVTLNSSTTAPGSVGELEEA